MKHNLMKLFALVMVIAMVLSAIPFASATGEGGEGDGGTTPPAVNECIHADTEIKYETGTGGSHVKNTVCKALECTDADKIISSTTESCTAGADGKCTLCGATLSTGEGGEGEGDGDDTGDGEGDDTTTCEHTEKETKYETSSTVGKHTKKVVCKAADCGETVSETQESCTDSDSDKKCDKCGDDIPEKLPYISCAQDGKETADDSVTMKFVLNNVDTDDVDWDITATGTADPEVDDISETGKSASATVYGDGGTAKVSVTATWDGQSVSDVFYVSFYSGSNYTVVVKSGVDEFEFTETGVFAKINGSTTNVSRKSLHTLLTDGSADRVILSEDRAGNARVGKITAKTSSRFYQYDPDDENDYALEDLEDLTFEVLGTGEYRLDYELYERGGGKGYTTTKGTITIVTGDVAGDIEYTCATAGSVMFDVDDFEDFWEEESDSKKNEDLLYVTFDVSNAADLSGTLSHDGDVAKASWKFYADYDKDKKNAYDLSEVKYSASRVEKNYTDNIGFVAYGEDGTKVAGTVSVTVKNTTMKFTDISTSDWFYDEVYTVWSEGIMNGTDDNTFSPNATLTRGMVVTMLYRLENEPATASRNTFSDVASGQWYTEAVEWAAKNDIVNGVGGDKFAPNDPITREQLATILYRYTAEYKDESDLRTGSLTSFGDAAKVSAYAENALEWAVGSKIINGDNGNLKPQGKATRAEAAAMFARFMDL